MSHNRRSVLKTLGAVGAGTVFAASSAAANEDNECVQVVDEKVLGPYDDGPIGLDGNGPQVLVWRTDLFYPAPAVFARSDFDGRRVHVEVTWGVEEESPNSADAVFQHRREGEWVDIAEASGDLLTDNLLAGESPSTENRLTMTIEDGEFRDETETTAVVDDDEAYRLQLDPRDGVVTQWEVNVVFEAFDTSCPSFKL